MFINLCHTNSTSVGKFAETDAKLYVLAITLSNQDNKEVLKQLKSGSEKTINSNKYYSKGSLERQN